MVLEEQVINQTANMGGLQPLVDLVQPLMLKASILLGGLFGIYLILLFARVHYERKKVKLLRDLRYDFDRLNSHMGLSYSQSRPGIFKKIVIFFKGLLWHRKARNGNNYGKKK